MPNIAQKTRGEFTAYQKVPFFFCLDSYFFTFVIPNLAKREGDLGVELNFNQDTSAIRVKSFCFLTRYQSQFIKQSPRFNEAPQFFHVLLVLETGMSYLANKLVRNLFI
ncbi:MAG: hypothetical protein WC860_01725 [Candidatus Margulisiibacteriota bacterium]